MYLNGEEVARDNMPVGAVGNTTHASVARSAAQEELLRVFVLDPEALSEGANTLAVEVHQALGDGSDLTLTPVSSGSVSLVCRPPGGR